VLVRIVATGVCHTDAFTLSGADPGRDFPEPFSGTRAAASSRPSVRGVTSVAVGDHVIPLYTPECGQCKFCKSGKTNLCQAIRATQGKGLMPDGSSRFSQTASRSFITWAPRPSPSTRCCPRSRWPRSPGCAAGEGLPARLRRDHRHRRGDQHRQGRSGGHGRHFRPRRHRPGGGDRRGHGQGGRIIAIDTNPAKFAIARQLGATDCINPLDYDRPIQEVIVDLTDGGVDYSFECIGNVKVMRAALECCHKGWGESVIIGVAGAGEEIATRPFQLVTGRVWRGSAFGGVRGRSELPGYVERAQRGEIPLDTFITHTMGLEDINQAFELMHEGKSIRSVILF
jgi:S-(hydroxymethyl)glutathione dehydrogenase/alcohol dehydrogenase